MTRPAVRVSAEAHNRVLRAATKRVDDLEPRLARLLEPILAKAGKDAAEAFRRLATDHVSASALRQADLDALQRLRVRPLSSGLVGIRLRPETLTAAAPSPTTAMVCVKPRPEEAQALADTGGEPAEYLHATLVAFDAGDADLTPVVEALRQVAATHAPLEGVVGGYGRFEPAGVNILLPDVPGLVELRVAVTEALLAADLDYFRDHGFEAHITIDAAPSLDDQERMLELAGAPLHFDSLLVVRGDTETFEIPLVGVPPLTAAGDARWSAPGADELIDADALAKRIREKTDPARHALVRSTMEPSLKQAGLSFEVTNPLVAKVLAQTGKHIVGIADTTRANVIRIVRAAHAEGLSIPHTADLIQQGMTDAARTRAIAIARTELTGAIQGGSLAATQLVGDATGTTYLKRWMTAPGAPHPRHELYPDLDGQTVGLDEYFDVGGSQLAYPGDPDGDEGETINCFPAETLVESPGLRAVTRRWYEGDLVRIRLASGDGFAATPNHPVLGADGVWHPTGALNEGDNLVRARPYRGAVGAPDPDRPPAEIGEVYRLAEMARDPERIGIAPPDFHGDGTGDEVDVVPVDGSLLVDADAASDEQIEEFGRALAYAARTGESRSSSALSDFRGRHVSATFATASFVRGIGEGATLVFAHALHPETIRVGFAPDAESERAQSPNHSRSSHAEGDTDREHALSAVVSLAQIIEIDRYPFAGYVYNLDSGDGWLTAGSIACRNCRCTLSYDDAGGEQITDADEPPDFAL